MNARILNRNAEVLLVEDSLSDIKLIEEGFKESPIKPNLHIVNDGVSAMDFLLKRGKYKDDTTIPDLVILDLNLPKMNGREVLGAIKSRDELKRIPVMIFTSSSDENDIVQTYEAYANCYLVKPINLDEFLDTIKLIEEFWIQSAYLPS